MQKFQSSFGSMPDFFCIFDFIYFLLLLCVCGVCGVCVCVCVCVWGDLQVLGPEPTKQKQNNRVR